MRAWTGSSWRDSAEQAKGRSSGVAVLGVGKDVVVYEILGDMTVVGPVQGERRL